jgi:hypothetical protein
VGHGLAQHGREQRNHRDTHATYRQSTGRQPTCR